MKENTPVGKNTPKNTPQFPGFWGQWGPGSYLIFIALLVAAIVPHFKKQDAPVKRNEFQQNIASTSSSSPTSAAQTSSTNDDQPTKNTTERRDPEDNVQIAAAPTQPPYPARDRGEVVLSVQSPVLIANKDHTQNAPLIVTFSRLPFGAVRVGSQLAGNFPTITPEITGTWTWTNNNTLAFEPSVPWQPGKSYTVSFPEDFLGEGFTLVNPQADFTAPPFLVTWVRTEFHDDQENPQNRRVSARAEFSYPVSEESVRRSLRISTVPVTDIFDGGLQNFELTLSDNGRELDINSPRISLPNQETFVVFEFDQSLLDRDFGTPLTTSPAGRVLVPTAFSLFQITDVEAVIIESQDPLKAPEQALRVTTSTNASSQALLENIELLALPADRTSQNNAVEKNFPWSRVDQVRDEHLDDSEPIALIVVPNGFSASRHHTFRYSHKKPGALFLKIKRGTPSHGGYKLGNDYKAVLQNPQPDPALHILPDGGLLALSGERTITIAVRGTRKVGVQIARLLPNTIQHLVTQSGGRFQNPEFISTHFTTENMTTVFGSTLHITAENDFSPVAIDVSLDALFARLAQEELKSAQNGLTNSEATTTRPQYIPVRGVRGAVSGSISADTVSRNDNAPPATGMFFLRVFDASPNPYNLEPILENTGTSDSEWEEDYSRLAWIYDEETGEGRYVRRPAVASRFLNITDCGVIAKENADGTRDIFIQSLTTGQPVSGAEVLLIAKNGTTLARATTNDSGRASFRDHTLFTKEREPVAYLVNHGTDTTFLPYSSWDRRLDFSRFDVDGAHSDPILNLDAFVFTERGIFRPGEEVRFGIALRRMDWTGEVDGIPLRVQIANTANDVLYEASHTMNRSGLLEVIAPTQTTSRSGPYRITVSVPRSEKESTPIGNTTFLLQEFQPDTIRVKSQIIPEITQGLRTSEDLGIVVTLENLYGGFPEGRRVSARVNVQPATLQIPQYPGYIFGHGTAPTDPKFEVWNYEDLPETTSNADGRAEFFLHELPLQPGGIAAARVNIEAFEADGGRSVPASETVFFAQRDTLLGVLPPPNMHFLDQNQPAEIRLRAVATDFTPAPMTGLSITIVEQRTFYNLRRRLGYYYYDSVVREVPVQKLTFDLSEEPSAVALKTDQPGKYKVTISDADGVELTSFEYNVSGVSNQIAGASVRESELSITLDKEFYEPGELMRISLQSAFPGPGLITLESDRVLHHEWFTAEAVNTVQTLRVPTGISGQVYVNVALCRALGDPSIRFSPLAYAVKPVTIGRQTRKLPVTIETVGRALPGEPITIRVSSSEPARAIIFAVDEGILNITNYRTPSPLDYAFRKFALQTGTLQTLDLVLPEASLYRRMAAAGGNGDVYEGDVIDINLNPFSRRLPVNAVFWSGPRDIGAEPTELIYTPPDTFNGTLRVMAVAINQSRLSDAPEKEILVRGPLVLEPNVPTFATPGDELDLSVTLHRETDSQEPSTTALIKLAVEQSGHFEILQPLPQTITLAPGQESTADMRVRVINNLGPAELRFLATLGTHTIPSTATLSIRPPTPRVTRFTATKQNSGNFTLEFPEPIHEAFAETRVSISPLPLGVADGLRRYLEHYPYGCTEQITSAAFCRLLTGDDGQPALPSQLLQKQITHVFTVLATRQNLNGSIGLWYADEFEGLDFYSPHVAMLCLEARESGLDVPENFERRLLEYIRRMSGQQPQNLSELRNLAYMLYIRARHGEQVTSHLLNAEDIARRDYKEFISHDFFTPLLASAHQILHNYDAANSLLDEYDPRKSKIPERDYEHWGDFYVPLVRDSVYLTMLARHFPERYSRLDPDAVDWLLKPITEGNVNSSSAAFATLALRALVASTPKSLVPEITLTAFTPRGEMHFNLAGGTVATATLPHDIQRLRVEIPNLSTPRIFTQTFQTGFPLIAPTKPENHGLIVTRKITTSPNPDDPGVPVSTAKLGDNLYVHLTLQSSTTQGRQNIAIVDLLPAGFEIPRTDLSSGPGSTEGVDYIELREDRAIIYCQAPPLEINRRPNPPMRLTYRVKPTARGRLQVPPIYAESMYDSRVTSLGMPSEFTVTSR